ncbi:MAG TPA: response regulator [Bacteroidota bacterium]|nr:response regulator [Bacteroidota bacterium]
MNESSKIRVLVAEDEESFRLILERTLAANAEFECEAYESGDDVIDALRRSTYDVLLLDYRMPGRSGLNILQWMHEQKMDTPVVMLTGAGSETIAVEAMKLGAYDYVRKDTFEKEHLPYILRNAFERFQFRREKALRKELVADTSKTSTTLELLLNSLRSFGELMNTSLAVVTMELETREGELKKHMGEEGTALLSRTFTELKRQYEVISLSTKSMLELAKIMFDRCAGGVDTSSRERELNRSVKEVREYSEKRSSHTS